MAQRAHVLSEGTFTRSELVERRRAAGRPAARAKVQVFWTALSAPLASKELWLQNVLGFLAARAGMLGELYPFGPAFFLGVWLTGERRRTVAAALSVLAGAATVLPWPRTAGLALVMLFALTVPLAGARRERRGGWAPGPGALLLWAGLFGAVHLVPGWLYGDFAGRALAAAVDAGLVLVAALVVAPAAATHWFGRERYDRSSLAALGVLLAVAGLGVAGVTWGWVLVPEVWNRWVTLTAAAVGGAAGGAAIGTAVGVLNSLTGQLPVGGPGLYAIGALFAGLFAGRGKVGAVLGYALGQMILTMHANSPEEIVLGAAHTAVAALGFAAVPRRWLGRMQQGMPGSDSQSALQLIRERRLRAAINDRLFRLSSVFAELADAFDGVGQRRPDAKLEEEGVQAIVEYAWKRQCQGCPGFERCWERNVYNSYWEAVDLVAAAERQGRATVDNLPPGLKARCIRPREFVAAINEARASNGGGEWRLERITARDIVPHQLRGAARLVKEIAEQVELGPGKAEEVESLLWEEFALRGISVRELHVAADGLYPEIEVEYEGECDGGGGCAVALITAVESVMQAAYTCEPQCRGRLAQTCRVRLAPEPPFVLRVEEARLAKGGGVVCGDSSARVDVGGGKVAVLLSDGMGTGGRAELESRATVGMIAKMIRAGFDRTFALHTVNSVLLLRSTDEVFATVDLAVVDQFTGEVEFLKLGSAPTFVKRGREVEVIRSDSLPVGILSEIELRERTVRLDEGDVLVMMTDGILDALPRQAEKEEWIARLLRRVETNDPSELVGLLVERARQAAGGAVRDDMTVIVARLDARWRR